MKFQHVVFIVRGYVVTSYVVVMYSSDFVVLIILEMVQDRYSYIGTLIGSHMWPIKWCQHQ